MDISPDTHFLESIRADRGSYTALLAEAVDNSFDAGSTEISLGINKNAITMQDNGIGITKDRQGAIVRLGEHGPMPTTALGTFGIGLKYHAISAGNVLDVSSISADGRMTLYVNWEQVVRNGKWSIQSPTWISVLISSGTGTQIKISALRWVPPTDKDIEKAREELPQIFYPALAGQRTISLKEAILLTHSYTDTAWFHHAEHRALLICFTAERIHFVLSDGTEGQPTQGQAFFYFGKNGRKFKEIFFQYGFIR